MIGTIRWLFAIFAVAGFGFGAGTVAAQAGPMGLVKSAESSRQIVRVHGRWDDDDDYYYSDRHYRRSSRYYKRRRGKHHVDAPHARVRVRPRGRVAVDAPYARVRVGRRGVRINVPYFNSYIPY